MRSRFSASRWLALVLMSATGAAFSLGAQAQVVISQAYGGGGNAGAPLNADFVELFNRGTSAVSVAGWSVQYASSTGTSWSVVAINAGSIPAGGYFLVKLSTTGPNGVALPAPDVDGTTISAAAGSGKLALSSSQTVLTGSCPTGAPIQDFVGYGTANCSETSPTGALSATLAAIRNGGGCTDNGTNSTDFTVAAPAPRNSLSPTAACGPGLPLLSISNASVTEGNSGTVNATFTVALSAPAGAGGVTFDIATADNTATVVNSDYVAQALTAQTIAAGANSYTFTVQVNGDTTDEPIETFFVNITNVAGATVADGQGQGTISNDDALVPILSISAPAAANEGSSGCSGGTTPFVFTISASQTTPTDVTFNWTTLDGTAQDGTPSGEDLDYVGVTAGTGVISANNVVSTVTVQVNCDATFESNETFSALLGASAAYTIGTGSAQATILNDDVAPISAIQGPGAASPRLGQVVATRGIVTSRVSNGYYIQSQPADDDGDPGTSEGLFVFTSSVPDATAVVVGNLVQVTGTVLEFIPATDPNTPPLTELGTVTTTLLSTGNPLPAPIALGATLPSPTGGIEQLENLENMRVTASSLSVIAPTDGTVSEANATATTNGRFYAVVTGTPRPFREAGLEPEDAAGQPASIPRFDGNPEKLNIESARARSTANVARSGIDVDFGATLGNVTGVLDYSFRSHRITLDFDAAPVVAGGRAPAAVSAAAANEFTVGSYNLERFFDTVNDPAIGEPVLTAGAFSNRLAKASLGIRNFLGTPDIVGLVEVENLTTAQALATRISADALAASQADPQYQAFLVEGNDVGGIDVALLVKTAPVNGATPRVAVTSVTQLGLTTLLKCPDGQDNLTGDRLNDRPPLLLQAAVNSPFGATANVIVIINHLRSLGSVNDAAAAPAGLCAGPNFTSNGDRVRRKRQQQAEFLANLVQGRQVGNPTENIIVVGDFNAFEVNDGYGDSMGVITGSPAADATTIVPGDGIDLVTPDLVNLGQALSNPPAERYSYVFDGNAQNLDHALVSASVIAAAPTTRLEHARINADFGEDNRADPLIPVRLSDHDALVVFVPLASFVPPDAVFANGFE
jgi:hypothetical protein